MPTYLIPLLMFVVVFIVLRRRNQIVAKIITKKNRMEQREKMKELAKRFIDKECLIYSFDGGRQFEGIIKEVDENAMLIEKNGELEAINLDFVIRIREYPKNKNGKKKSIVVD